MRMAMIGAGYVGLVSGACFAEFGHMVTCVDSDAAKIAALKRGEMPIFEPGLAELVAKNARENRLSFTTELADAVKAAEVVFIAVGTPSRRGDGHADLSYVFQAAREIAEVLDGYKVIITKSTVPVGTGDEVARIIAELRPDAEFAVASNPEFLREGAAIADFKHPDRIVVGTEDERARGVIADIYRPLFLNQAPILFTGRRAAELIKYAANAFLATKITFINEIADLCEQAGADVQEVARGIGLDNRIGTKFLNAGPGYGGSCFPKDALGAAEDRAGFRHAEPHRRDGRLRQRAAQTRHGAQGHRRLRRQHARQHHRRARPYLQAQYRRHARGAVDRPHHGAAGRRRQGARLRSGGHEAGPHRTRERRIRGQCLRLHRGRGRPGDRDGMGAVPRARSRPGEVAAQAAGRRRSAQRLSAGGHGAARLHLRQRRPANGRQARERSRPAAPDAEQLAGAAIRRCGPAASACCC